jgi:chitin synthase
MAIAHMMTPESSRVLFSQWRRWINSTVYNLCELIFLPELSGLSFLFLVSADFFGTLVWILFAV